MSDAWTLRILRWGYVAFIAYASMQTFVQAWGAKTGHHSIGVLGLLVLSGTEVLAVIAFLTEALDVAALGALLVVFAVASVLTIGEGEVPLRFLYFAATATYITIAHRRMGDRPRRHSSSQESRACEREMPRASRRQGATE